MLVEKSGVPVWVVWVLPGVLFACMHTLMPMVKNGFVTESFMLHLVVLYPWNPKLCVTDPPAPRRP